MKFAKEWVAGILAVLLTSLPVKAEIYEGKGIVKEVRSDRVSILLTGEECSGVHTFYLKDSMPMLREGNPVRFVSTGNPCEYEIVYLLEVFSSKHEEVNDAEIVEEGL